MFLVRAIEKYVNYGYGKYGRILFLNTPPPLTIFKQSKLCKGIYWISSNFHLSNCDSNIGLFFIAPPLIIDLPTLR